MRRLLVSLLLSATALPATAGTSCINYGDYLHTASFVDLPPASQRRLAVSSGRAYVAAGATGLHIIDVSNSHEAHLVRTFDTPGSCSDVQASGNTAYVGDGSSGLQVIDVTSPMAPTFVGNWNPGSVGRLDLSGSLLAAFATGGLHLLDVSDADTPVPLGSVPVGTAGFDLKISGSYVYLGGSDGFRIVDISNVASPVVVGFYPASSSGDIVAVDVQGDRAYIMDSPAGFDYGIFRVLDVSNPALPVSVAEEGHYYGIDVAVSADLACVVDVWGPYLYDIGNPADPLPVGSFSSDLIYRVVFTDEWLYLSTAYGLHVVDIPALTPPPPISEVPAWSGIDIEARGIRAYASGNGYFEVLDVSNPSAPVVMGGPLALGSVPDVYEAEKLDVSGSLAAVSRYADGIRLVDVTDPAAPALRGTADTPGEAWDVVLSGGYAYVADGSAGVAVVQVTNPVSPAWLVNVDTPGAAYGVAVSGSWLYVADGTEGIRVFDLSNPALPVFAGGLDTPGSAQAVLLQGSRAYVNDTASLRIIDISVPSAPAFLGRAERRWLNGGIAVDGDFAYVGSIDARMVVFNVSVPTAPMLVGEYRDDWSSNWGGGQAIIGGHVYSCNDFDGISVLPLQCAVSGVGDPPVAPRLLELTAVYPNPSFGPVSFGWRLAEPADVHVLIADLSGRRVGTVDLGSQPAGLGTASWDGRDARGADLPSGIYFLRVTSGGESAVKRFVRIR